MKKLNTISSKLRKIIDRFPISSYEVNNEGTHSFMFAAPIKDGNWEVDAILINPYGMPRLYFQIVRNGKFVAGLCPAEIIKALEQMNAIVNDADFID